MQIAMNIWRKTFEKENILLRQLVDKTNARVMQLQTDHILEQDGKIEKLNGRLMNSGRVIRRRLCFCMLVWLF